MVKHAKTTKNAFCQVSCLPKRYHQWHPIPQYDQISISHSTITLKGAQTSSIQYPSVALNSVLGTQTVCLLAIQDTPNLFSPPTCIFCSSETEHGAAGKGPVYHDNIWKRLKCVLLGLKKEMYMRYFGGNICMLMCGCLKRCFSWI